jgi:hypothetical protein
MSDTRRGQLLRAKLIEFIAAGDPAVTAHLEGLSDEPTSTCTAVWSPSAAAKGGKGRVAPHEYVAPLLATAESRPMAGTPAWGWRRLHRRRRAFGWLPIFALVSSKYPPCRCPIVVGGSSHVSAPRTAAGLNQSARYRYPAARRWCRGRCCGEGTAM